MERLDKENIVGTLNTNVMDAIGEIKWSKNKKLWSRSKVIVINILGLEQGFSNRAPRVFQSGKFSIVCNLPAHCRPASMAPTQQLSEDSLHYSSEIPLPYVQTSPEVIFQVESLVHGHGGSTDPPHGVAESLRTTSLLRLSCTLCIHVC